MITDFLERAWDMLNDLELWAWALSIAAIGTNVFGESFWAVILLSYSAIFADTITRWIAVTKKFYIEKKGMAIEDIRWWKILKGICGEAWRKGYLQSRYFSRILEKLFTYTLLIMLFHLAGQCIPDFSLGSLKIVAENVFPSAVAICIFLIELSSINENLVDMGHKDIAAFIGNIISFISSKFRVGAGAGITPGDIKGSINENDKEKESR